MKQVVTFLNRKEGSGKTTLALNLAAVFASELNLKTVFLDYSEKTHETELLLDLKGSYGFDPSKPAGDYMLKKENFMLFWAGQAQLKQLIEKINGVVDVLVIDTAGLPPEHLLEVSDRLLIPSALNHMDIKYANYTAQWLLSLNYPVSLINYIINKNTNKLLSLEDLQEVFKKARIAAAFNHEKDVEESTAKGKIYYFKNKKGVFIQELKKLAEDIAGNENTKDHAGIAGKLRRRKKPRHRACPLRRLKQGNRPAGYLLWAG